MDFTSNNVRNLHPYTWGEQPKLTKSVIKLNTNENPYPPHPSLKKVLQNFPIERFRYYPDPVAASLTNAAAKALGINRKRIVFGNGSDEIIANIFKAFFNPDDLVLFTELTYSYYQTFANVHGIKAGVLPVEKDLSINLDHLERIKAKVFFLTNPNTPTGIMLPVKTIEHYVKKHFNMLFIIDEAYADFSGENCLSLVKKYDNVIVIRTASKAFSFCGGRLGYAVGSESSIEALQKIRDPYNINLLTMAMGENFFIQKDYYRKNCEKIKKTRKQFSVDLEKMGFTVYPSDSNFILCFHPQKDGLEIKTALEKKKIYIRHFSHEKIKHCVRISIGTPAEMKKVTAEIKKIVK